ncbi:MAG: adhesin [Alphaproteobacteria bacterium]|nr:adhesin [Alphaproteobacteria bacterium]
MAGDVEKGTTGEAGSVTGGRPTPKQSEIDVGNDLPEGAIPQPSFKDGESVPYGTPGSVRPDYCVGNICSIEVKNYNIETNSSGLIDNVSKQAIQRAENLPDGMVQDIVIDTRGQSVTQVQRDIIKEVIIAKSGGIIKSNNIRFR